MHPSKSVSSAKTCAPWASGWTSCADDTIPRGSSTATGSPAAAPYAASDALVSPVLAQHRTRADSVPSLMACRTTLTSTVIPRSLKLPVCELPHSFSHRSPRPISLPSRSAQKTLVPPSPVDTMQSSGTSGATHSRLPHTPDPYGHCVRIQRSSKSFIQAAALRSRRASTSCATSSRPSHVGQR